MGLTQLLIGAALSVLIMMILSSLLFTVSLLGRLSDNSANIQKATQIHRYFQSLSDKSDVIVLKEGKIYFRNLAYQDGGSSNAPYLSFRMKDGNLGLEYYNNAFVKLGSFHTRFREIDSFRIHLRSDSTLELEVVIDDVELIVPILLRKPVERIDE